LSKITSAYNQAWKNIEEYSKKSPWKERFIEHCDNYMDLFAEDMKLSRQEFVNKINSLNDSSMSRNIFFACMETFIEKEFETPADNIVEEYLKRRRWKMSKESALCLEEMKNRSFSIYEVVDTKPGEYAVVKDVLLNTKEINVYDESGSRALKPLMFVISKVIQINGEFFFSSAVFVLNPSFVEQFKKHVKKELKEKKFDFKEYQIAPRELSVDENDVLRKYTPDLFISGVRSLLVPAVVLNPNGDEISFNSINFLVKDENKAVGIFDGISELERGEDKEKLFWIFTELRKNKEKTINVKKDGITLQSTNDIFLGDVELKGKKLLCNTMTKPASEKLIKILRENLGDLLSMPVIEHENLFDKSKKTSSKKDQEFDMPEEVEQKIIEQFFDEHLRKSLDEKIPILNNKTPRKCTKSDRQKLLKWLEMMEQNAKEQIPGGKYDMSWVYEELGINR